MTRLKSCAIAILLCFTSICAWARPEHNAFLNRSVFSAGELVRQVKSDPVVLHRYEKHFKMSEPTLVHYFQGLHLEPLKQAKRYLVYNVDDSFTIRHRLLHLTPGTLVFADANHKPVLKRTCGNPMTAYLPALGVTSKAVHSTSPEAQVDTKSTSDSGDLTAMTSDSTVTLTGEQPEAPTEVLASSDTGTVTGSTTSPPAPELSSLSSSESGMSGQTLGVVGGAGTVGASLLGIFGAAGGAIAIMDGGGHRGAGPPAVPEPASAVVLLGGIFGITRWRKTRAN